MEPKSHLLLEIGVEELPASYVDAALAALPEIVTTKLAEVRLGHGAVRALGTPRRLAVVVHDVDARQSDVDEEVIGPPETAAFKDKKPTKAAEAFAAKLGTTVAALLVVDRPAAGKQMEREW
jgi:glycyl-tRNA synthetase beta chain